MLTDHRAGLVALGDDPHLVLQAPAPPTLPPGDNLHHAIHPHTSKAALRSYLRRQEDQTQTALGGGIRQIRVGSDVNLAALRRVLAALRE